MIEELVGHISIYLRLALLILIFLFFVLFTQKITEGVARSFGSVLDLTKLLRIDRELLLKVNRNYALTMLVPLAAFLFSYHTPVISNPPGGDSFFLFLIICFGAAVYLLVRGAFLTLLDYLHKSTCFKTVNRFFRNYLIVSLTLASCGSLLTFFIPGLSNTLLIHWLSICFALPYIVYLYMVSRHIFENNFSLFFYILYICALEIVPLVLLVRFGII